MGQAILRASVLLAVLSAVSITTAGQVPPNKPAETKTKTGPQLPPERLELGSQVLGEKVEPQPGEICLVCGLPIGADDVVYLAQGHRIPLHGARCFPEFKRNPWKFLALIEPHGAFLGSGGEGQGLSKVWFLAGLYVLVGLVFAAGCAHEAFDRGRRPAAWFAAGLVLNVLGYLLLLTRPRREVVALRGVPKGLHKVPATYDPRPCPGCGQPNHPAADECVGCGGKIEPAIRSEVQRAGLR